MAVGVMAPTSDQPVWLKGGTLCLDTLLLAFSSKNVLRSAAKTMKGVRASLSG